MWVAYKNHGNTTHYLTEVNEPVIVDVNWAIEDAVVTVSRTGHPCHRKSNFDLTIRSKKGAKVDAKYAKDIADSLQAIAMPKIHMRSSRIVLYEYIRAPKVALAAAIKIMLDEYMPDVVILVNVAQDVRPMLSLLHTIGFTCQLPVEDLDGRPRAWILSIPSNVIVMAGRLSLPTFQFCVRKDDFHAWMLTVLEASKVLPILKPPEFGASTSQTMTIEALTLRLGQARLNCSQLLALPDHCNCTTLPYSDLLLGF